MNTATEQLFLLLVGSAEKRRLPSSTAPPTERTKTMSEQPDIDPRINDLRWTSYRGLDHLWLGQATACGRDLSNLRPADAHPFCTTCLAYAQGWLDSEDFGPAPQPGETNPTRRIGAPTSARRPADCPVCKKPTGLHWQRCPEPTADQQPASAVAR